MKKIRIFLFRLLILFPSLASAQLAVTVLSPRTTGQKVVVPMAMQNLFDQKIESARASVFLLDEKGKLVAESTKWVIGGTTNHSDLASGATNTFYFVFTIEKPISTTNLTTKAIFNRVVLEHSTLADAVKDVRIQTEH